MAKIKNNHNFEAYFKMDRLTAFYDLKQLVLLRYQETYPYVALDWSVFSSKDILQLIDDIEETTKQRISEKWIYTHLKPLQDVAVALLP